MSETDRDLVAALRAELAAVDPSRPCDRLAEIAGLGTTVTSREASVSRLAVRLGGRAPADRPPGARRVFVLPDTQFDWSRAAEHCRMAWLRGRFLARGSLSLAVGRAHLEFVVTIEEAPVLAARLAAVGLPASWRVRRGHGVVTWKSTESIASFLGRIGASASLLELEARSVARTMRGDLNRVIDALEADGRLGEQPRIVRAVAGARRETPEASLSEIAVRLDIHRSAVQRALDRVERLALHDDEGIGRRVRNRPSGGGQGAGRPGADARASGMMRT